MTFERPTDSTKIYVAQLCEFAAVCTVVATILMAGSKTAFGEVFLTTTMGTAIAVGLLIASARLRQAELDVAEKRRRAANEAYYKLSERRIRIMASKGVSPDICADLQELLPMYATPTPGWMYLRAVNHVLDLKQMPHHREEILRCSLVTAETMVS